MASLLAQETPRLLTVEEFLQIDFGPDLKAELDNGVIYMMAGGTREHARIQTNIIVALGSRLRGSGCRPYGSDMGLRTHDLSLRYPDVTVDCGSPNDADADQHLANPRAVFEVLSLSTRQRDLRVKKEEYRAVPCIDTIVFVDPDGAEVSIHQRFHGGWTETLFGPHDVELPSLGIVLSHADIFARD